MTERSEGQWTLSAKLIIEFSSSENLKIGPETNEQPILETTLFWVNGHLD